MASVVVSGYGFGSCFWYLVQTHFVNPDNLPARSDNGTRCEDTETKYFQDQGWWNINFICKGRLYRPVKLL